MPASTSRYSLAEEIANGVTHGLGAALALAGSLALVVLSVRRGTAAHVVGCAVFGATLVLMYTASTLYHSIPHARVKGLLQVLDHSAIYLVIAGTYTPFMLVSAPEPWGWSLLAVVWTAGVAGIVLRAVFGQRWRVLGVALYLVMGWAGVVVFRPMTSSLGPGGMSLVVSGGVVYTLGVIVYVWHRLPFNHAIWHLFVLGGSALHFLAVLWYVIPPAA
jgi:hemolysin III